MAIFVRAKNCLLSRLKALTRIQRFNHTLAKGELQAPLYSEMDSDSVAHEGHIDMSKWTKVDSRKYGINRSMISSPSWIVLKLLRNEGFEAYLVGGCVRDLILNKIPKDFDVITTATLHQIRKQFYRAEIVGRRFPICRVHIKGSVIEVSSFETVARRAEVSEKVLLSKVPSGCDKKDVIRWRDSMHRDFTINSLFFDPFMNKIYDYANGMADLRSLKVRTLIPAHLSFKEDSGRILRGLRIAARLGLSFSKDTETAICNLSSSIESLDKSRIMMELNYMLSYGAAEPSICLLRRYNLLEILLPLHAAFLDQQSSKKSAQSSIMLMKLFFNLDKLVSCDRPADCSLWVGLLAFHLALVNNPQEALVIQAFASVLYHGKWKEGVDFAREHSKLQVTFVPEILGSSEIESDGELAKEVTQLASLVQNSICALTDKDSLFELMSRYPIPCSGLVFVPKKKGKDVAQIFDLLVNDVESYENRRENLMIDYYLLGKGDPREIRFTLGKIILETICGGLVGGGREGFVEETNQLQPEDIQDNCQSSLSDLVEHQVVVKKKRKRGLSPSNSESKPEMAKKLKLVEKKCTLSEQETAIKKQEVVLKEKRREKARRHPGVVEMCQLLEGEIHPTPANMLEKKNFHLPQQEITEKKKETVDNESEHENVNNNVSQYKVNKKMLKSNLSQDEKIRHEELLEKKDSHPFLQVVVKEKTKRKQALVKEKSSQPLLSSLFK